MTIGQPDVPALECINSERFVREPAASFAELHRDNDRGIWRNPVDDGLVITRYALLKAAGKHPAFQAQDRSARVLGPGEGGALQALFSHHPVFMNEPEHMPVHRIAYQVVASTGAANIADAVRARCERQLDVLLENEEWDLVADYCLPIAAETWAALVGVEGEHVAELADSARKIGRMLLFDVSEDDRDAASEAAGEIRRLAGNATASLDSATDTYKTAVTSYAQLDYDDACAEATDLLAAMTFDAIDGSAGMTANFSACILQDRNVQKALRDDASLIPGAWVEATRLAPALLGLFRCPVEDTEINGVNFEAGVNILMLNAAGNQDPAVYVYPDRYDIHRKGQLPLTFGIGGRACVGRMLAKIQGEVAMATLLDRTEWLSLQDDVVDWPTPGLLRSPQSLRIEAKLS